MARASEWVDTKLNTRLQTDREIRLLAFLPLSFQVGHNTLLLSKFHELFIWRTLAPIKNVRKRTYS